MQAKPNSVLVPNRPNISFVYIFLALVLCCSPSFAQTFTDQTSALFGSSSIPNFTVSWGDYNADGYVDLLAGNWLRRNNGPDGSGGWNRFTDVIGDPINGLDGIFGDFDNDGDLDIYSWNGQKIYRYDGGTTFTTIALPSIGGNPYAAVWGDWDSDANLDLFVVGGGGTNYLNKIVKNNGNGTFTNKWSAGPNNSRAVTAADFDNDGDLDIYTPNYWQGNNLHHNPGGTSANVFDSGQWYDSGAAGSTYTGGAAFGDFDNDGDFDIATGDVHGGAGIWKNLGAAGGYKYQLSAVYTFPFQDGHRAPTLADYDNDGDLDILITVWANYGNEARLFRNDGNFNFTNVTTSVGLNSGMGSTPNMGAAWADIDNDGDMDLIAGNKMWINSSSTNGNHWIKLRLQGDGVNVNSAAIGSSARITVGANTFTRQVEGATGGGGQNDLTLHFGLGSQSGPVDVEITWADGSTQTLEGLAVDNTYTTLYDGYIPPPPPVVTFTLDDHGNGTFDVYASTQPDSSAGISYYNIDLVNILTAENESPMGFDADAVILRGFTIGSADLTADGALFAAQDTISGDAPDNLFYGIGQTAGTMNTLGTPRGVPWDEMVLIASGTYTYGGPSPEFGDETLANIFTEEWIDGEMWEGFVEAAGVELVYTYSELPIPGDFDLDGDVDGVDFFYWQIGYPTASGATWNDGDLDGDGDVDGADFGIWQANYPTAALVGSALTQTPEPATLLVLTLASLGMIIRRRR